jgi:hypothetical protein
MMPDDSTEAKVSRRIEAPAARIFAILADPQRHPDLDGSSHFTGDSQMLRGAVTSDIITGVGDVFAMKMYFDHIGDYVIFNHVVEFEPNRRIGWAPSPGDVAASNDGRFPLGEPTGQRWRFELTSDGPDATVVTESYDDSSAPDDIRAATKNGKGWIDTMTETLARLDEICTQ